MLVIIESSMNRMKRLAALLVVWLTAVSTLLAEMPRFRCLCPDGQVKQVCAAVALEKGGCGCCSNGCCRHTSARKAPPERSCCAHKVVGSSTTRTSKHTQADRACCTRTPAPGQAREARPIESSFQPDQLQAAMDVNPAFRPASTTHWAALHWPFPADPPVDLVTTLGHLLI